MSTELHSNAVERLGTDTRDDLAQLFKSSHRDVANLDATGRLPMKLGFGRACRYLAPEVQAWLEVGAPARDKWEVMKAAKRKGESHA